MKPGRNDPCSCGSGKKYKKCCGQDGSDQAPASRAVNSSGKPNPEEIRALVSLSSAGRFPEAIAVARDMTGKFPQHGFGWKALGTLLVQLRQSNDALIPMQKAAALSPGDAAVHYNGYSDFRV